MWRLHIITLSLMLFLALWMPADGQWFFLPNFTHDVRGLEARPEQGAHFYSSVPEKMKTLLESEKLSERQKKALHWHPATFPHRDFVDIMPMRKVFGWYTMGISSW